MKRIVPAVLRERTGMRLSDRSHAGADILMAFRVGEFTRAMVFKEFGGLYSPRCLDRALFDLEASGAIECVHAEAAGPARAVYRAARDVGALSERQAELAEMRLSRHHLLGGGTLVAAS